MHSREVSEFPFYNGWIENGFQAELRWIESGLKPTPQSVEPLRGRLSFCTVSQNCSKRPFLQNFRGYILGIYYAPKVSQIVAQFVNSFFWQIVANPKGYTIYNDEWRSDSSTVSRCDQPIGGVVLELRVENLCCTARDDTRHFYSWCPILCHFWRISTVFATLLAHIDRFCVTFGAYRPLFCVTFRVTSAGNTS